MTIKVSEESLVIPKEFLAGMDEVEIRREQNFVVVGPAKTPRRMSPAERRAGDEQMAEDEAHESVGWFHQQNGATRKKGVSGKDFVALQTQSSQWSSDDLAFLTEAIEESRQVNADEW